VFFLVDFEEQVVTEFCFGLLWQKKEINFSLLLDFLDELEIVSTDILFLSDSELEFSDEHLERLCNLDVT